MEDNSELNPPPPSGCVAEPMTGIIQHKVAQRAQVDATHLPDILMIFLITASMAIITTRWLQLPAFGIDWLGVYRPAVSEILSWRSPYNIQGFYNPPWTLLPLIPFAVFPAKTGMILVMVASLAAFYYVARKIGAHPITAAVLIFSPAVVFDLMPMNVNSLVVLGLVLPPQVGLFFVLIKPQVGAVIALFWLVEAWRDGGFKQMARIFTPATLALIASFLIYGFWPLNSLTVPPNPNVNISVWPEAIPIGLVLLVYAIRKRDERFALYSAPMFYPYIMYTAWAIPLLGLIKYRLEFYVAVMGLWLAYFLRIQ